MCVKTSKFLRSQHSPESAVDRLFDGLELAAADIAAGREAALILFDSLWSESGLTPQGLALAFDQQRAAVKRLAQIEADRAAYPMIQKEQVVAPIILAGAPRSGTTFLHSLMAQDPAFRSPLAWETLYPSPPPRAETYDHDPRIQRWEDENFSAERAVPNNAGNTEFAKKHLMAARLPEECGKMLASSVRNMDIWAVARATSYFHWFLNCDMRPAFSVHKKWLQHLQWRKPAERWLLKYPSYGYMWPALFDAYPDAIVVETHRDPAATISSLASLIGTLRKSSFETQDPLALGIEMLHFQELNYLRPIAFRRAHPGKKFVDISYAELVKDPISVIRRLYAATNLNLSAETERRMIAFIKDTPQGKHGVHEHDLKSVGLDDAILRERLQPYYAQYEQFLAVR